MTIHHDKLAYGKLAPTRADMSDKQIEDMIKLLNGEPSDNLLNTDEKSAAAAGKELEPAAKEENEIKKSDPSNSELKESDGKGRKGGKR